MKMATAAPGDADDGWPEPRANPELIGQEAAEHTLRRAFAGGRPAHAWLIAGQRGIGKATLAFRFARHLLSQPADGPDLFGGSTVGGGEGNGGGLYLPPGHPVFRRVAGGGHADLATVQPGWDDKRQVRRREIVVEDVRAVIDRLAVTAAEGGWRVVVIDPAEAMNRHAADALLKTLEEPPPGTVLLLVSHAPGMLPATIRSRCRVLMLRPLAEPVVDSLIRRYRPETSAADAALLARLSRGSIGTALTLAGGDFALIEKEMRSVFDALPQLDLKAVARLGEAAETRRDEDAFPLIADLLSAWLTGIIRVGCGAAPDRIVAADGATLARLSQAAPLERWLQVWDKAGRLLARTESANMDRRQIILTIFLSLETVLRK
jgi:DNA polymerase-3 subunit delta'